MKECLQVTKRYDAEGLGKSRQKMNDTWWEDSYNKILTNIKAQKDDVEKDLHYTRSRSRSESVASNYNNLKRDKKDNKKQRSRRESNASTNNRKRNNEDKIVIISKNKKVKAKLIKIYHSEDEE